MMGSRRTAPRVAIACGGTGGHFFPGLAVGETLLERGVEVRLLISAKPVDRQAASTVPGMVAVTLPAVGYQIGRWREFLAGLYRSYWCMCAEFRARPVEAVLAFGGFTSAGPILAGKAAGARTYLHEANSVPGRANRWLAHGVDEAFVYFPEAAGRLWHTRVCQTGMPVRCQIEALDPAPCRMALGLAPDRPVLLVTGGSQGASALNELAVQALSELTRFEPQLQFIHLTGAADVERVREAYRRLGRSAVVRPFLTEMELALGAATVAVCRAGASSLAELAAVRLPAILIPYPAAADNHQYHNARAFAELGAARMLVQRGLTGAAVVGEVRRLLHDEVARERMSVAMADWHFPGAANRIAEAVSGGVTNCRPAVPGLSLLQRAAGEGVPFGGEAVGVAEAQSGGSRPGSALAGLPRECRGWGQG
ncbi:MAG: UDP-N-acetylglucosamine--N-acetylmuramyl-(pentapeptide) pyrophosphoryl-undecaprenol N-acetylglucosamine transferase [Verrucomicrobia bacterium]|nr:UDP-N-acetylglucosamine--N-acetylmuramyl-(pentapeptide) pyrophosphoryl-undecaprenol N-acetylglucosamine transferase [Verrucomicrobiota bacterium]